MAPPQVFVIELENENKVFYPGQTINGRVILHCQEQKKLRSVYLTLVGRADVHWSEQRGFGCIRRTVPYNAKESFFSMQVNLWGEHGGSQHLEPGVYDWPFSFQLPSTTLPTSYEGPYGNIRYWLEARMDRPWKFNHVTKFAFTVLERVDLNPSQEELTAPRRGEGQKMLGYRCCQSDPLTLAASTDRSAYCAGENILLNAQLENSTNREIRMLKATLRSNIVFHARGASRQHQDIVAQMQTPGGIPARHNFKCTQQPLSISACPPTSHTCRIIHTDYFLDVEAVVPTSKSNLHVTLPVVIGTEPLRSVYPTGTLPSIGFASVEAVNIADNQYTMGQTHFAPVYSVVQMSPVAQSKSQPSINPHPSSASLRQSKSQPSINPHPSSASLRQSKKQPSINPHPSSALLRQSKRQPSINPHPSRASLRQSKRQPSINPHPSSASLRQSKKQPPINSRTDPPSASLDPSDT